MQENWIVMTVQDANSLSTRRYTTVADARQKARAMAQAVPGRPVLIYKLVRVVEAPEPPVQTPVESDPTV